MVRYTITELRWNNEAPMWIEVVGSDDHDPYYTEKVLYTHGVITSKDVRESVKEYLSDLLVGVGYYDDCAGKLGITVATTIEIILNGVIS